MKIGQKIKDARLGKNLTQEELAEKVFVSKQSISKYENDKSKPTFEVLKKLSEILEDDFEIVKSKKHLILIPYLIIFMLITYSTIITITALSYKNELENPTILNKGLEITYLQNELNRTPTGSNLLYVKLHFYNTTNQNIVLDYTMITFDFTGELHWFDTSPDALGDVYEEYILSPNEEVTLWISIIADGNIYNSDVRISYGNSVITKFNVGSIV